MRKFRVNFGGGRRQGKEVIAVAEIEMNLDAGRSVIFAVPDQKQGIDHWREHFSDAMFEIVGAWGIKIYRRQDLKRKRATSLSRVRK